MILMPQIFDVTANENARYKRNELEYDVPLLNTSVREGVQIFTRHSVRQTNFLYQSKQKFTRPNKKSRFIKKKTTNNRQKHHFYCIVLKTIHIFKS